MVDLTDAMKVLLADTFAFRLKAQFYHWNISGPDFIQYHDFLGKIYVAADADIDTIAEHIRALRPFAPGSLGRFKELSTIDDEENIPAALEMISRLASDNMKLKSSMISAHDAAEEEKEYGTLNFLEGLLDANEKTQWMLESILKR